MFQRRPFDCPFAAGARAALPQLFGGDVWWESERYKAKNVGGFVVLPSMVLDFSARRYAYGVVGSPVLEKAFSGAIGSFTRASTATYFDASGTLSTAAVNTPRYGYFYNSVTNTWDSDGLIVEEQRTNLLLNSATLSTQSVTVTAQAYTLSFYGLGSVTLSGASTAGPVVGTGDNTRTFLTFTPAAGTLTLTVSGSVKYANLEAGTGATSWIPTTSGSATRSADNAYSTDVSFLNTSSYTLVVEFNCKGTAVASQRVLCLGVLGSNNSRTLLSVGTTNTQARGFTNNASGTTQADLSASGLVSAKNIAAYRVTASNFGIAVNGSAVTKNTSGTPPTPTHLLFGRDPASLTTSPFNGTISRIMIYNDALSDASLSSVTV